MNKNSMIIAIVVILIIAGLRLAVRESRDIQPKSNDATISASATLESIKKPLGELEFERLPPEVLEEKIYEGNLREQEYRYKQDQMHMRERDERIRELERQLR